MYWYVPVRTTLYCLVPGVQDSRCYQHRPRPAAAGGPRYHIHGRYLRLVLPGLEIRKIKQGDAGPLGIYPILSVLPDKFARFLFEFHSVRFERLDLQLLPADRSDFDVHGALEDDKVKTE